MTYMPMLSENLRQVPTATGQALADKWGCAFVEASAKFNFHIDQVFTVRKHTTHTRATGMDADGMGWNGMAWDWTAA